ncbi:MAG: hypothetical protein VSS75_013910 [Candidatus Parabeggiatoa sp.]|nr:hypothetical protein [Candidatus Parabeggiatoa sp.]
MKKTFNIAGPCHPAEHYMLLAQERCVASQRREASRLYDPLIQVSFH